MRVLPAGARRSVLLMDMPQGRGSTETFNKCLCLKMANIKIEWHLVKIYPVIRLYYLASFAQVSCASGDSKLAYSNTVLGACCV